MRHAILRWPASADRPASYCGMLCGFPSALLLAMLVLSGCSGCGPHSSSSAQLELTWGRRGVSKGRFQKPRAMAIDDRDQLYIVDKAGRIQVYTSDGKYLRGWRTPEIANGKPSGLSFDRAGNLMVADTHYYRVLFYTPAGKLLEDRTIGGTLGHGPGEFGFVTDAVQDSAGNYYIAEYGEYDRIQKFASDGRFLLQWGSHGSQRGQFIRPQNLAIDSEDRIWVADACNHRIQVFDASGDKPKLVRIWGQQGSGVGQLSYPYDLALDGRGHVYVCEFGNHRIQKFTLDGRSLGCWGTSGRNEGQLSRPWALVIDSKHRIDVLDTYNNRVHRIRF